jgi:hypothetical protein
VLRTRPRSQPTIPKRPRVHIHFFLAALRDVFFFLALCFGAARFLAAALFATFFFAGEAVVAPSRASALAPLAALTCIAVATVPRTALAAAVEAPFAVVPAVAAALATSPASTLVLSAALFPAARTVSRALVMVPLRFISDPPLFPGNDHRFALDMSALPQKANIRSAKTMSALGH